MFYAITAWLEMVLGVSEHVPYPALSRTMFHLRNFGKDLKEVLF